MKNPQFRSEFPKKPFQRISFLTMFKNIIHLIFPKTCAGCSVLLIANENIICTTCRHNLPLTHHHRTTENNATHKFYGRLPIEYASAMLYFHKKGIVQQLIHNLKYRGRQEIGKVLGEWYVNDLKNSINNIDYIVTVPLHKKRLRERGYNQVLTFSTALSKGLQIPMHNALLFRKKYSKTQTQKNLLKRTSNRTEIFDVLFTEQVHNKHFLLVDDVLTTGATLEQCGNALLKIPGARLSIVTIAQSQS